MVRILLIDKNSAARSALHGVLTSLNAEFVDGTELSISIAGKSGCDAVLVVNPTCCDVTASDVPVLYCYTSNPGADKIAQVIEQGAAEVLLMPFSSQLLAFKLQQLGVPSAQMAA
jgi:CheY-like chemotaxis protein